MRKHPLRIRIIASTGTTTVIVLLAMVADALAVQTPFGVATPETTGPAFTGPLGGFFAVVAYYQSMFYKALTHTLGEVKHSGHAFVLLAGVSFLYGIFHAVGPGHGKSVISSYLLVSRQTVRRGVFIAFCSSLMQGFTAIGVVLIAAVIMRATAIGMTHTTDWFEIMSYALVAAVGAWLLWIKATGRGHHHHHPPEPALAQAGAGADGQGDPNHSDRDHAHEDHVHRYQAHDHEAHDDDAHDDAAHHHNHDDHHHGHDHGHSHAPDPKLLSKPLTASRAWAATLAVGIRPCTGAIIVLVFALSQHLLLVGIGSVLAMSLGTFITVSSLAALAVSAKDVALRVAGFDSQMTERIMHGVEIAGALVVLLLGLTLLGGALQGGLPG